MIKSFVKKNNLKAEESKALSIRRQGHCCLMTTTAAWRCSRCLVTAVL